MEPFSQADAEALAREYLGSRGLPFDAAVSERFWTLCPPAMAASPLFLSSLLHEWRLIDTVTWKHAKHIDKLSFTISASVDKGTHVAATRLLSLMLDRWEEEYETTGRQFFGDILSVLAVARGGLTEEDILALTQIDPAALATFLHVARELLTSKSGPLAIMHQVVSEVVGHRYMAGAGEVNGVRAQLTAYLKQLGYSVPRACVELPYQFRAAENIPELRQACQTLGVFSTFFSSGLEPELLDHWRLLAALGQDGEGDMEGSGQAAFAKTTSTASLQRRSAVAGGGGLERRPTLDRRPSRAGGLERRPTLDRRASAVAPGAPPGGGEDEGGGAPAAEKVQVPVKKMAHTYRKALRELEAARAGGMPKAEQLRTFGVSLDSQHEMQVLLSQLARFLARTGQNLACIEILEKLVEVHEAIAPRGSAMAGACQRLALQCWRIGYFDKGLPYAVKSFELQEHLNGKESVQAADASQLLALVHLGSNELDKAEAVMGTSLKVREAVVGRDHPSVAEALLHMGKIALRQGAVDSARELQLRANRLMGARSRKATRQHKDEDGGGEEGDRPAGE